MNARMIQSRVVLFVYNCKDTWPIGYFHEQYTTYKLIVAKSGVKIDRKIVSFFNSIKEIRNINCVVKNVHLRFLKVPTPDGLLKDNHFIVIMTG